MKVTTIALAIAFALPSTLALARGGMQIGSHATRLFANPVGTGVSRENPEIFRGIRLLPSRTIQADQHSLRQRSTVAGQNRI